VKGHPFVAQFERLRALINLSREERFLEYKESRSWNDLKGKIAKTAMGMANIRDGGTIIVGVDQRSGHPTPGGMSQSHVDTYNADDVQAYVNRFADPYVWLELDVVPDDYKDFVAITIYEFDQIPVVCKRDRGTLLRRGAIYTRSNRIPETCDVQSQTEMREIVYLATDNGIRRFVERSQRAGLSLEEAVRGSDSERFEQQLGNL
jgi:predicted HTH transcriptional regulator